MKQIIFTISKGTEATYIYSKSLLVDEADKDTFVHNNTNIYNTMHKLTTKYNERNIAVLFEID